MTGVRHEGIDEINPNLAGAGIRVGIVMARFNVSGSEMCWKRFVEESLAVRIDTSP